MRKGHLVELVGDVGNKVEMSPQRDTDLRMEMDNLIRAGLWSGKALGFGLGLRLWSWGSTGDRSKVGESG